MIHVLNTGTSNFWFSLNWTPLIILYYLKYFRKTNIDAEKKKAEGNTYYTNQQYREAVACYTEAIGKTICFWSQVFDLIKEEVFWGFTRLCWSFFRYLSNMCCLLWQSSCCLHDDEPIQRSFRGHQGVPQDWQDICEGRYIFFYNQLGHTNL